MIDRGPSLDICLFNVESKAAATLCSFIVNKSAKGNSKYVAYRIHVRIKKYPLENWVKEWHNGKSGLI